MRPAAGVMTWEEIGSALGITRQGAHAAFKSAMRKIRRDPRAMAFIRRRQNEIDQAVIGRRGRRVPKPEEWRLFHVA